jgi:hypothetical protein
VESCKTIGKRRSDALEQYESDMITICDTCGGLRADPGEMFGGKPCECPTPTLADLRDQVEKLKLLLDDPQPGLISWVQMYGERMKWINDFWNR